MLHHVDVRTGMGGVLRLFLGEQGYSGFAIEEVGGLSPVQSVIATSSLATTDGVSFQSARRESRNITFKIALVPDFVTNTTESLMKQFYSVMMTSRFVYLEFYDDMAYDNNTDAIRIEGYIESVDGTHFESDMTLDVSIVCPDPDFYSGGSDTDHSVVLTGNEILEIDYRGSVPTGYFMQIDVGPTSSQTLVLSHDKPDYTTSILKVSPFPDTSPDLKYDTTPGYRYMEAGGISHLHLIDPSYDWPLLLPGINRFYFSQGLSEWKDIRLMFSNRYGGI